MNIWIMITISFFAVTACYCGKREFFDQKEVRLDEYGKPMRLNQYGKPLSQVDLGTSYTIEDVNKAYHAILEYFGGKENANITITKVISIKNSPGKIQLRLFIYNPIKNVITGYTIDVKTPLTKKESAKVILVVPFSKEEQFNEYSPKNDYATIDMNQNIFT